MFSYNTIEAPLAANETVLNSLLTNNNGRYSLYRRFHTSHEIIIKDALSDRSAFFICHLKQFDCQTNVFRVLEVLIFIY